MLEIKLFQKLLTPSWIRAAGWLVTWVAMIRCLFAFDCSGVPARLAPILVLVVIFSLSTSTYRYWPRNAKLGPIVGRVLELDWRRLQFLKEGVTLVNGLLCFIFAENPKLLPEFVSPENKTNPHYGSMGRHGSWKITHWAHVGAWPPYFSTHWAIRWFIFSEKDYFRLKIRKFWKPVNFVAIAEPDRIAAAVVEVVAVFDDFVVRRFPCVEWTSSAFRPFCWLWQLRARGIISFE